MRRLSIDAYLLFKMEKNTVEGSGAEDKAAATNNTNNTDSKNSSDAEQKNSDAPVKSSAGPTKSASSKSGKKPAAKPRSGLAAFLKGKKTSNSGNNSGEDEILVVDKKSKSNEKVGKTAVPAVDDDKVADKADDSAADARASKGIADGSVAAAPTTSAAATTAADSAVEKTAEDTAQNDSSNITNSDASAAAAVQASDTPPVADSTAAATGTVEQEGRTTAAAASVSTTVSETAAEPTAAAAATATTAESDITSNNSDAVVPDAADSSASPTSTATDTAPATDTNAPSSSSTVTGGNTSEEGGGKPPAGSSDKKKKSSFLGSMFGGKKKDKAKDKQEEGKEDRTSNASAAGAAAAGGGSSSSGDSVAPGEASSSSSLTGAAAVSTSGDITAATTENKTAVADTANSSSSSSNLAPAELGGSDPRISATDPSSSISANNDVMDGNNSSFNSTKKVSGFDSGSGTEGEGGEETGTGTDTGNISLSSPMKGKEFKKSNRYAKGGGADTDTSDTDGGDYYEGRKPMSPFAKRVSSRVREQHEEEARREAAAAEAAAAKEAAAAALSADRAKHMSPFAKRIATRVAAQNVVEDATRRSMERLSSPDTSPERQRRQKAAVDADKPQKPRFSKNRKALNSETQEQYRQGRGAPVGGWPLKPEWTKALLALRLQSIWRGKVVRKRMRTRKTAAASVQNFFRTAKARVEAKFSVHAAVRRKAADEERARRLRDIRNKERELELLRTMPPEQYAEYDKLRANRSAGKIQRMWRDKSNDRLLQGGEDTQTGQNRQGADAFKFASKNKISEERDSVLREKKAMHTRKLNKENEFNEQVHKLLSHMDRDILNIQSIAAPAIAKSATAGGNLPFFEDWCPESDAMGLALLHSKIKDKAIIRSKGKREAVKKMGFGAPSQPYGHTRNNNPSYGTAASAANSSNGSNNRNDSRVKFQELQDAKMRANILLEEYHKSREYMERRKAQRYRVLGNVESLKNMLAAPLYLEQGREAVRKMRDISASGGGIAASSGTGNSSRPSTATARPPPSRPPLKNNPNSPTKQKSFHSNSTNTDSDSASAFSSVGLRTAQKWLDVYSHLSTTADNVYTSSRGATHHDGKKILPGEWEQTAKLLESEKRLQEDTFTANGGAEGGASASGRNNAAGSGSRRIDKDAKKLVEAAQLHAHTMQAVTDKNHWSVVTLPLTTATPGHNPASASAPTTATNAGKTGSATAKTVPLQEGLNEAKIFRPLVAEWASGSDVEESLYWVSYCCQEPKIQLSDAAAANNDENDAKNRSNAAGPTKEDVEEVKRRQKTRNDELLRRVAAESLLVSRRASDAMVSVEKERQKEMRLAKHHLNELLAQARASAAKELQKQLGHEKHMRMMMAAIKMQKLFRGRQARKRAEALAAQRRVQRALDNLLFELAGGGGGSTAAAGGGALGLGAAGGGSAAAKALFSAVNLNRGGGGGPLPPPAPALVGLSSLRPPLNKQHTAPAPPSPSPSPSLAYSKGERGYGQERERSASPAGRVTLQPQSVIKHGAWGAIDPNLRMSGGLDPYHAAPSSPSRQMRSPAARKVNDFLDNQPAAAGGGGILRAEASAHTRNPLSTAKVLFNSVQRPAAPPSSPPTEGKFNRHNQFAPGANSIPSGNQLTRSDEQPFSPNAHNLAADRSGLLSEASSIIYDADGAGRGGDGFISPPSQSHSTAGANSFFNNKTRETGGTASGADISMNLSHSHSPRGLTTATAGGGSSGGNVRAPPSVGRGGLTLSSPVKEENSEDDLFGTLTSHYETTGFDSPHSHSPNRKRGASASGLASSIEVSPRSGGGNKSSHKKTVTLQQHEVQPTPLLGASMESYDPMDPVGRLVSPTSTHAGAPGGSPIRKPPVSALQNAAVQSHSTDVRANCKGAFAEVDRRYADMQLTLGTFAESALTADPTNFSRVSGVFSFSLYFGILFGSASILKPELNSKCLSRALNFFCFTA